MPEIIKRKRGSLACASTLQTMGKYDQRLPVMRKIAVIHPEDRECWWP
jgi:Flp pilus assembly protein TadD